MELDKRMYWIRNMGELKMEGINSMPFEFELSTDSHIVGQFNYGPYTIGMWDIGSIPKGIGRKLYLKTIVPQGNDMPEITKGSKEGYYHGGTLADEIVVLASLFLRRRIKLVSVVRRDDIPLKFERENRWLDKHLIEDGANLAKLDSWFKMIEKLDSKWHLRYILAAKFYHKGIFMIEEDPDLAYINFISAIEVLSYDLDIGLVSIDDVDKGIAKYINMLSGTIKDELTKRIIRHEHFVGRKFVKFILDNIEEDFWTDTVRPPLYAQVKKKNLAALLKKVYNQRSKTLHTGEPFPPDTFHIPIEDAEIDFSGGVQIDNRFWNPDEFIPYPHFFERLINHVLKTFLKKHQSSGKVDKQ